MVSGQECVAGVHGLANPARQTRLRAIRVDDGTLAAGVVSALKTGRPIPTKFGVGIRCVRDCHQSLSDFGPQGAFAGPAMLENDKHRRGRGKHYHGWPWDDHAAAQHGGK